jgi:hypothetical protein
MLRPIISLSLFVLLSKRVLISNVVQILLTHAEKISNHSVQFSFAQKVFLEPCRDAEERNSQQLDAFLGKAIQTI